MRRATPRRISAGVKERRERGEFAGGGIQKAEASCYREGRFCKDEARKQGRADMRGGVMGEESLEQKGARGVGKATMPVQRGASVGVAANDAFPAEGFNATQTNAI